MTRKIKNKYSYWIPRIVILIFASLIFIFALLSGAEQAGGGLIGIYKNIPNALPWLILFGIVWLAWKKPQIGGIVLILFSIFITFAFETYNQVLTFLLITGIPLVIGILFLLDAKQNTKS